MVDRVVMWMNGHVTLLLPYQYSYSSLLSAGGHRGRSWVVGAGKAPGAWRAHEQRVRCCVEAQSGRHEGWLLRCARRKDYATFETVIKANAADPCGVRQPNQYSIYTRFLPACGPYPLATVSQLMPMNWFCRHGCAGEQVSLKGKYADRGYVSDTPDEAPAVPYVPILVLTLLGVIGVTVLLALR